MVYFAGNMVVYPNCKINLGLSILEKRNDGFHAIESVFYPVGLCDRMQLEKSGDDIELITNGLEIAGDPEDNLVVRAYRLLEAHGVGGIKVVLDKVIPMGAGLGGGSSDASYFLKAANSLYDLGLSDDQLTTMALSLGSDCPFFIDNRPKLVTGRGEVMEDIDVRLDAWIVLINPGIHIGTAEAYAGVTPDPSKRGEVTSLMGASDWQNKLVNDFEAPMLSKHKPLRDIKSMLSQQGASYVSMTGSGSTMYGLFKTKPEIDSPYFTWIGKLD